MKRLTILAVLALAVGLLASIPAMAAGGNGAPSGQHYNLNIIGVENPKNAPMDDTSGHTIFVPLFGKCNIQLKLGDFQVLDRNCFDGDGPTYGGNQLDAAFQLPAPDPGLDGVLDYSVWVRVKQARGSATMQTCTYDTADNATYCYTGNMITLNKANYSKFTDVSKNLLTVCANTGTATEPNYQVKPLFWDSADQYWWEYYNSGLKLAQFRFYPNVDGGAYPLNNLCAAGNPKP